MKKAIEMDTDVIRFYLGEETKPVVEGLDRYDNSIFQYQMRQALSVVATRIGNKSPSSDEWSDETNNIVAFVGERGAGKTSCMYSVIRILEDIDAGELKKNEKKRLFPRR